MKLRIMTAAFLSAIGLSGAFATAHGQAEDETAMQSAPTEFDALAIWSKIYEVFSHPRCVNCLVPEDNRPRWSGPSFGLGDGEWAFHGMNIDGGESRDGADSIPCKACHADTNSELPHGPPGEEVWLLAPVEMNWWGKSSQEVCEQIKDPARNGGRTLQHVADHVAHDHLVLWGWDPGPGREPAPYSAAEIAASIESWAAAGAPCPADD